LKSERFGFVKTKLAPEAEAYEKEVYLEQQVKQFPYLLRIHEAHVVMLTEQKILKHEEAAKILQAISDLKKASLNDPSLCSYMTSEAFVIQQAGEVGGKMHTGRSRNDLTATSLRMYFRDRINEMMELIIKLRQALIIKAQDHIETVMPGYTHWQQAQPFTAAHYLLAHVDASGRCILRLEAAYKFTNQNPLGAGAFAGTGWDIDRDRTTFLLGFEGLIENTCDAVAARDFLFDAASAITILLSNISRLAEDLQIWSSVEFSGVDYPAEYAGSSSIMPQKKNPYLLEVLRGFAGQMVGGLTAILTTLKGTSYTNISDHRDTFTSLDTMLNQTKISLALITGIVTKLNFNRALLLQRAATGFSTMTELADALVQVENISFRTAHEIVAEAIVIAVNERKKGNEITKTMLDEAAMRVIKRTLTISNDEIHSYLDPVDSVHRRIVKGGPSPNEVQRMINDRFLQISNERERLNQRKLDLERAYDELTRIVESIK